MRIRKRTYPMGDTSEREIPTTLSGGESRTHSAFADDCDLPKKIRRLVHTGQLEEALKQPPLNYGDFTNAGDYMTALMNVKAANEAFMALPAATRREFNNDPAALLAAIDDPAQNDRLVELGLLDANDIPVTNTPDPSPTTAVPAGSTPTDPPAEGDPA